MLAGSSAGWPPSSGLLLTFIVPLEPPQRTGRKVLFFGQQATLPPKLQSGALALLFRQLTPPLS